MTMDRVRVRYVLTGACMPVYSGRVVHAIVPLRQSDDTPTTIGAIKAQFRVNWPADMKELADSIVEAPIRVLKTGRVLTDTDVLEQQLTATERDTCLVSADETVGEASDEMQKPSVLMHMVIQKSQPAPVEEKPKKEKPKASSTNDGANSGETHEVKKDSCCSVM